MSNYLYGLDGGKHDRASFLHMRVLHCHNSSGIAADTPFAQPQWKTSSEARKHCTLAVVRRRMNLSAAKPGRHKRRGKFSGGVQLATDLLGNSQLHNIAGRRQNAYATYA